MCLWLELLYASSAVCTCINAGCIDAWDDMMLAFFPDWNESFEFDCFIECDAVHVFFFCRVNGERSPKRAKQSHSSDVEEKCDQDYTHIRTRSCEYIGQLLLHRAHRKKRGDSILFLSFFFDESQCHLHGLVRSQSNNLKPIHMCIHTYHIGSVVSSIWLVLLLLCFLLY